MRLPLLCPAREGRPDPRQQVRRHLPHPGSAHRGDCHAHRPKEGHGQGARAVLGRSRRDQDPGTGRIRVRHREHCQRGGAAVGTLPAAGGPAVPGAEPPLERQGPRHHPGEAELEDCGRGQVREGAGEHGCSQLDNQSHHPRRSS